MSCRAEVGGGWAGGNREAKPNRSRPSTAYGEEFPPCRVVFVHRRHLCGGGGRVGGRVLVSFRVVKSVPPPSVPCRVLREYVSGVYVILGT